MDKQFKHPFAGVLSGPSGSGKTVFIYNFLKNVNSIMSPKPDEIIYCYGEYQPIFDTIKNQFKVTFIKGLFDFDKLSPNKKTLLIIDDLMADIDSKITRLFTKGCHHRNISCWLILQNLFARNREMRTISLNAHYIVCFKNPRDASQITYLGSQMYPTRSSYFKNSYKQATAYPYGYLLVDLKQDTPDILRLKTDIFNKNPTVFIEN